MNSGIDEAMRIHAFGLDKRDGLPPPPPISISPPRTRSLMMASAIKPEEHCRSTVMPGTDVGPVDAGARHRMVDGMAGQSLGAPR